MLTRRTPLRSTSRLERKTRLAPVNRARRAKAYARNFGPRADAVRAMPCLAVTPAWQDNHVVDPRRLWEIYDGETYWIAAPTEAEAIAIWQERPDASKRSPLRIRDVTERAATISIVGDEGIGPPRSARQWMDVTPQIVVVIGTTAW